MPPGNNNSAAHQADNKEVESYATWNTDLYEFTSIRNVPEEDEDIKVISPSMDRSSYLLDLSNEKPKERRGKKSTASKSNKISSNLATAANLYHRALAHMNAQTQVSYLADANWGLALVLFEQIHIDAIHPSDLNGEQRDLLQEAFNHAEAARQLYRYSGDAINAASVTCDIALFEQATGNLKNASKRLNDVVEIWSPMLQQRTSNTKESRKRLREYNNIVSAASCYLAGIEIEKAVNDPDRPLNALSQSECDAVWVKVANLIAGASKS